MGFGGKSAERYWDTVGGLEIWDDVTQTWTLTSEPDAIPGLTFRNDSGKKYGFGYLVMTSCPSCGMTMNPCHMIIMNFFFAVSYSKPALVPPTLMPNFKDVLTPPHRRLRSDYLSSDP